MTHSAAPTPNPASLALPNGACYTGSPDSNILASREYLIHSKLTRKERLYGWAQKYNISPHTVGLAAIALISGFALLLLAQSAGAILAGRVIGLVGLGAATYQLKVSMQKRDYLNGHNKDLGRGEFPELMCVLRRGSYEFFLSYKEEAYKDAPPNYYWLKCALSAYKDMLGRDNLPFDQEYIDFTEKKIKDPIAVAMVRHAAAEFAERERKKHE